MRGSEYLDEAAKEDERLGALHTEGLSDSWANVYQRIALAIEAKNRGDEVFLGELVYPGIEAGIDGIRWIENCVRSADQGSTWVDYEHTKSVVTEQV
ncbi:hypothetical protein [Bacillus sp. JCM 19041]|uniref:hypothetical protein n=1 Tax=Bacillus sp. JCM 19041 TaxID=1460637 RepID=UPI000A750670